MMQQPIATTSCQQLDYSTPSFESISSCIIESGSWHGLQVDMEKAIAGITDINVQTAINLIFAHINRVELDVRLLQSARKPTPDERLDLTMNVQQASPCIQHAKICDPMYSACGGEACRKEVQLQQLSEWQPFQQHVSHPVLHHRAPMHTPIEMTPQTPPHKEHILEQNHGDSQPIQEQQNQGINLERSKQEAGTFQVRARSQQPKGKIAAQLPMWLRPSIVQESGQPSKKSEAPQSCRLPIRKKTSSGLIPASKFMSHDQRIS